MLRSKKNLKKVLLYGNYLPFSSAVVQIVSKLQVINYVYQVKIYLVSTNLPRYSLLLYFVTILLSNNPSYISRKVGTAFHQTQTMFFDNPYNVPEYQVVYLR